MATLKTPSEIEKEIKKIVGQDVGLLSKKQIHDLTNFGEDFLATFLLNLPSWGRGRGKRYALWDVAERLAMMQQS